MPAPLRPRVPRSLALLLVAVAILGAAWALFTPPWQAPDEPLHYAYTESLAQRHAKPGLEPGGIYSSAQFVSLQASNGDKLNTLSDGRPQWSKAGQAAFVGTVEHPHRTDDGGGSQNGAINKAGVNPPAFYVMEVLPYAAAAAVGGGVEARLYAMRLLSVGFLLVTVLGAWLLVGELFGPVRPLQLAGAGFVGLLPMASFVSSSVTPDALLYATWSLALWLGVRILDRGLTRRDGVALAAVTVVALLTKGTSAALLLPVGVVLALSWWRRRRAAGGVGRAHPGLLAGAALAMLALALVLYRVAGRSATEQLSLASVNPGQVASYLWQFYLPRPGFLTDIPVLQGVPVYDVWVKDLAGRFGWLQISQPGWLYLVLGVAALGLLVVGGVGLVRRAWTRNRAALAFLAAVALVLIAGIHYSEYRLSVQQGFPFMQGRYLLPLAGLFASFVAGALSLLRPVRRPGAAALLLGCMVALQIVSFSRAAGFWFV